MVQLAVIIKRRMWNIRGTAEGKGGEMKCIRMRCAECLPWAAARHFVHQVSGREKAHISSVFFCVSLHVWCLSFTCRYGGPHSFGSHSTRPQLFWKQWNRIRHKSVLMVGSVLWKGFSESLFSRSRRGKRCQSCSKAGLAVRIHGCSPPPQLRENLEEGQRGADTPKKSGLLFQPFLSLNILADVSYKFSKLLQNY